MAKKKGRLDFIRMKEAHEQVAWVTAYDFPTAQFAEAAEMDMILVGDSLGMCMLGYKGTIPVTMTECISHCQAVRRGAPNTFCIGDMPFGSYQVTVAEAVANAVRFLKEADMDAIKLEGGLRTAGALKAIADAGILAMGHIGLTPQSSGPLGGFKAQGLDPDSARFVIEDALAVQEAGAYSLLMEAVPPELCAFVAKKLSIPVYSIGAGQCDGQVLISSDMLGMFQSFTPKFVKVYAHVGQDITNAFKEYVNDVHTGAFPTDEHCYHIRKGMEEEYARMLKEYE
jgi:3-methyl-2-oxobutanoate hydroxymethyltransferase